MGLAALPEELLRPIFASIAAPHAICTCESVCCAWRRVCGANPRPAQRGSPLSAAASFPRAVVRAAAQHSTRRAHVMS